MDGTIEEIEGATTAPMPVRDISSPGRRLPDDVRASLEAVKTGQRIARERARREMWRARAVVAGVATVAAIGVFIVRPRIRAGRAASAATVAAIAPATTAAPLAAAETAAVAGVPSPGGLLAAGVADLPAPNAPDRALPASDADFDDCHDGYVNKRWRAAAEACAAAFTSRPTDAKLALRVAEAQYARDHLVEAREWARRTLALDATQADALAIVAHAEQRTGDAEAAARAFRRYLALAPRGWHSAEARAALRDDRSHTSVRGATSTATAATVRPEDAPMRPTVDAPAATADAPSGAN